MISYPYFKKLLSKYVYDRLYFEVMRNQFAVHAYYNGRLLVAFAVAKKDCKDIIYKEFGNDSRNVIELLPELFFFDNDTKDEKK